MPLRNLHTSLDASAVGNVEWFFADKDGRGRTLRRLTLLLIIEYGPPKLMGVPNSL